MRQWGTVSIDIPKQAKLIISCSKKFTGEVICIIRERKIFPEKTYSFVPNYDDTTRVFIQSGKESLVYNNNTSSVAQLHVFVSNHFKENIKNAILPFSDDSILYVKRQNENDKVLKPLKQRNCLKTGQNQTFTYFLQPGYSLNIKTYDKNLTGYCYFKKKALGF